MVILHLPHWAPSSPNVCGGFPQPCPSLSLSSHLLAPSPSFAHQRRGHAASPNSESAGPGWDPSCCTAPSERCPGGTVAREGGSPHRSSTWLRRSLPPDWRSAFRRGSGGDTWAELANEGYSQTEGQRVCFRLALRYKTSCTDEMSGEEYAFKFRIKQHFKATH